MTAKNTIPLAQMGSIPMITFSSSTCVTVQSLHGSEPDNSSVDETTTAALSRNLRKEIACQVRETWGLWKECTLYRGNYCT
jgi:hypothetical protein